MPLYMDNFSSPEEIGSKHVFNTKCLARPHSKPWWSLNVESSVSLFPAILILKDVSAEG